MASDPYAFIQMITLGMELYDKSLEGRPVLPLDVGFVVKMDLLYSDLTISLIEAFNEVKNGDSTLMMEILQREHAYLTDQLARKLSKAEKFALQAQMMLVATYAVRAAWYGENKPEEGKLITDGVIQQFKKFFGVRATFTTRMVNTAAPIVVVTDAKVLLKFVRSNYDIAKYARGMCKTGASVCIVSVAEETSPLALARHPNDNIVNYSEIRNWREGVKPYRIVYAISRETFAMMFDISKPPLGTSPAPWKKDSNGVYTRDFKADDFRTDEDYEAYERYCETLGYPDLLNDETLAAVNEGF